MKNELCHYGVKGQMWGVRRYQNKDGILTPEGKMRNRVVANMKTTDDANRIVKSLSSKEKKLLGATKNKDWIDKQREIEISTNLAKRFVEKYKDQPISFLEIWDNGSTNGNIAIATNSDPKYRGKGYASKNIQKAIKWFDKYGSKTLSSLYWEAEVSNIASQNLAKKHGFQEISKKDLPEHIVYSPKYKTYIYGKNNLT